MCANCIVSSRLQKKTSRQFLWAKSLLVLAGQKSRHGSYKGTDARLLSCLLLREKLIVCLSRTLSVAVLTEIWLSFFFFRITVLEKPLFSHSKNF